MALDDNTEETEKQPAARAVPLDIPSQQDVELELLRKKKMELLLKYASDDLQKSSENAKTLLGRGLNF